MKLEALSTFLRKYTSFLHILQDTILQYKKKTLHFPHFSLSFPEFSIPIRFIQWTLISICLFSFGINLVTQSVQTRSEEEILKDRILVSPFQSSLHSQLAQYYIEKNREKAKYEFSLAQELQSTTPPLQPAVLGLETTTPLQIWNAFITHEESLKTEAGIWQKICSAFPDYQYAEIKLAALYYQLGEIEKAKSMLADVFKRNPQSPLAQSILAQFKNR